MNKLSLVLVAVLSLTAFGCKKKGADCAQAINHSMELSKADMQKMGNDDKMMQKMRDIGLQHCKDDKWPDDAIRCMTDAKNMTDSQGCYSKLSAEQQSKMNKAAMELMTSPAGDTGAGAGSAPPATGSGDMGSATATAAGSGDMGSAAAGSAAGSAAAGSAGSATK